MMMGGACMVMSEEELIHKSRLFYSEENNVSPSSPTTPTVEPQGSSVFDDFDSMKHKLYVIYDRVMASRRNRTRGPGKNLAGNEFDADSSSSGDEKDGTSVFNPIDLDGDSPLVIKCPGCDFDIKVSSLCDYLEDPTYNSHTMICPVCDKNLEEDVIRMVQSSRIPISPKRIPNRWKDGVSINDWELYDKINASWGETKPNPTSDSHFSQSRDNVFVPSSNEFFSDDTISDASDVTDANDIPIGKSSGGAEVPDTSHEEDVQERSNKAAFAQELFMSALFSE